MATKGNWDKAAFKSRLESALHNARCEKKDLAEYLGFQDQSPLSAWFTSSKKTVPTVQQILDSANYLGAYPGWLGYGEYPLPKSAEELMDVLMNKPELMKKLFLRISTYFTSQTLPPPAAEAETIPLGTVIEQHETGQKLYTSPVKPETKPQAGVASEPAAEYPAQPIEPDAFAWVRGLTVKRSPDFDLKKAMLPPRRPALEEVDELAAAAHLPTFSGDPLGPIVAETEPTEIKYDRKTHFTLRVTGRSMYPQIFDGDKVIVEKLGLHLPPFDPDHPSPPDEWKKLDGEIVVAIKNEDAAAYLKRLEFTHNKKTGYRILLKSDNPKAKSIQIEKEDSLWLVGVVREIVRSPKNMD